MTVVVCKLIFNRPRGQLDEVSVRPSGGMFYRDELYFLIFLINFFLAWRAPLETWRNKSLPPPPPSPLIVITTPHQSFSFLFFLHPSPRAITPPLLPPPPPSLSTTTRSPASRSIPTPAERKAVFKEITLNFPPPPKTTLQSSLLAESHPARHRETTPFRCDIKNILSVLANIIGVLTRELGQFSGSVKKSASSVSITSNQSIAG